MIHTSFLEKLRQDSSLPPDYTPFWVTIGIIGGLAILSVCIFLYVRWQRKVRIPVTFAGKTMYVLPGEMFSFANANHSWMGQDWLSAQMSRIQSQGHHVAGLFTDSALTIPFNNRVKVTAPIRIYPKIIK